jgi:hypothetical protein
METVALLQVQPQAQHQVHLLEATTVLARPHQLPLLQQQLLLELNRKPSTIILEGQLKDKSRTWEA